MRVLLTGASGLIGSALLAGLVAEDHDVVAVARHPRRAQAGHSGRVRWVAKDISKAKTPEAWHALLTGVDAVVNSAGVLQDNPWDDVAGVHASGISSLFAACEQRGLKVIQISAIGVGERATTEFAKTKRRGDDDLMARALDWIVLRPSVVLGRAAYGGSALMRGLAALPIFPRLRDTGPLQVVQLDELVETTLFFLRTDAPAQKVLDVAGPEGLSVSEVVAAYRSWFGWRPARVVTMPRPVSSMMFRFGDLASLLGWSCAIRSTARRELIHGAVGDNSEWQSLTGIRPQRLADALAAEPPSVQERWFARLYFLKPLTFAVLSGFWIATGLISLGPGYGISLDLLHEAGFMSIAPAALIAGAIADIVIGACIAFRPTARRALYGALVLCLFYAVCGSVFLPRLWAEPLGPLLKIWPIFVLIMIALAIVEDR